MLSIKKPHTDSKSDTRRTEGSVGQSADPSSFSPNKLSEIYKTSSYHTIRTLIATVSILPERLNSRDSSGQTVLHWLCQNSYKFLITTAAPNQVVNSHSWLESAEEFVVQGAYLDIKDNDGKIPEEYLSDADKNRWREKFRKYNQKQQEQRFIAYAVTLFMCYHEPKNHAETSTKQSSTAGLRVLPIDILNMILLSLAKDTLRHEASIVNTKLNKIKASVSTFFQNKNRSSSLVTTTFTDTKASSESQQYLP
jgi:hypothetical protein